MHWLNFRAIAHHGTTPSSGKSQTLAPTLFCGKLHRNIPGTVDPTPPLSLSNSNRNPNRVPGDLHLLHGLPVQRDDCAVPTSSQHLGGSVRGPVRVWCSLRLRLRFMLMLMLMLSLNLGWGVVGSGLG